MFGKQKIMLYICGVAGSSPANSKKLMETKNYQNSKGEKFFKFLNNYEADIWIRGSRALM